MIRSRSVTSSSSVSSRKLTLPQSETEISAISSRWEDYMTFVPFTKASYQKLVDRERVLKSLETKRAKYAQEAHLVDGELKFGTQDDEILVPNVNPDLKEGNMFTKSYGRFPSHLLGVPIEELDPGIREKTFVIISSRYKKKYISRFTATKSLFIFTPWNPVRKAMLAIATHQLFDVFIFLTIIMNCVFLAMPTMPIAEKMEYIFLAIYTLECIIKVMGRGFIFGPHTYLRDPWNWLDFIVIDIALFTLLLQVAFPSMTVTDVRGLRTFRVLRALKTVSIVPGLKTIVSALLHASKMLFEVILLTVFFLMIFAMCGLQAYAGVLRQKCVLNVTGYVKNPSETFDDYYIRWTRNSAHWYAVNDDQYVVCGNNTGAGLCPVGYTCIPDVGENPRYGFLSFDHFGCAALSSFQLVALDFWEDIYNKIIRAKGPWSTLFFIIIVFFGSFFLMNLMLAVVSISYEEEALRAGKEREREKKENARKKHNALYDVGIIMAKSQAAGFSTSSPILNPTVEDSSAATDSNENAMQDVKNENFTPSNFRRVPNEINDERKKSSMAADSNKVTIIKADVLLDPEVGVLDFQVIDRNCDCCGKWVCFYVSILKIQNYFYIFVSDPLFDFMITISIITNTCFMALEHHNQPELLSYTLSVADYLFTVVFFLEACFKIIGLGKYYFTVYWNLFDLLTVVASVLDMCFQDVNGLDVLRTFRLLRVLKLAQSWPTMRLLVTIILNTLGALGNLCVILCIVTYIFAVIGMQLFRESYMEANFDGDSLPRWNFVDFYHSMLMIFRVLCGEWIEPLYQCMRASNELCFLIFLPALVLGNFVVLNLFLALLLNAFASDSLDRHRDIGDEKSKLADGWQRLKQLLFCCCISSTGRKGLQENQDIYEDVSLEVTDIKNMNVNSKSKTENKGEKVKMSEATWEAGRSINEFNHIRAKEENVIDSQSSNKFGCHEVQVLESKETSKGKNKNSNNSRNEGSHKQKKQQKKLEACNNNAYRDSFEDDTLSRSDITYHVNASDEEVFRGTDIGGPPPDCLPVWLFNRIKCLNHCATDSTWIEMRAAGKNLVDHQTFEFAVMVIILGSSLTLVFEDIYLYQNPILARVLQICNIVFAILFTFEMLLKWIGLGLVEYFTNSWTILDFCIVLISLISLTADAMGASNIAAFRSLRTFRALRPLRAVSRWEGMKIVVNALMNAIPAIMNVFLVCMVFWLIFSIMGVQFFKGRFFKCVNEFETQIYDYHTVPDRNACKHVNGSWQNLNINFDNAANGFLALFQVATFEGWMEVIDAAVDATDVDKQPRYEASRYSYLYFVVFIVFGSFFSLNLFIGVIIDNFNVLKKRYEGSYLDAFLTQSQRSYYNTLKKLATRKPKKTVKRPQNKFQLFFYNLAVSTRFEMSIVLLIFLNMTMMALEHYKQTEVSSEIMEITSMFFTCLFTLETIVKIIGLRVHYFRFEWNVFDFIIIILSILGHFRPFFDTFHIGTLLNYYLSFIVVTPTLLRIVRIFHIGRVLRLIGAAKGIRKLLFAIIVSLPAVFNIGALLFMIIYIYAIIGMSSFSAVKLTGAFDETVNFQTFGNSFMLLLRLSTAAGWNDILEALLIHEPYCNPRYYTLPDGHTKPASNGDCGIPYLAIPYMVSYIIIVWLIVVNMYIAVLLENFSQAHVQEEVGITEDDFDMFYIVWEKYDPFATQFIKYEQLGDLVGDLEPPLQILKPNDITLVTFNIPILEGDKMHCIDILMALLKNVLSDVEDSVELKSLKLQMEEKFAKKFPSRYNITVKSTTLQRKKEDVAARTLQRSWRSYKAQRAMKSITAHAQRQQILRARYTAHRLPTSAMSDLSNRLDLAMDKFFHIQRDMWDSVDCYNIASLGAEGNKSEYVI